MPLYAIVRHPTAGKGSLGGYPLRATTTYKPFTSQAPYPNMSLPYPTETLINPVMSLLTSPRLVQPSLACEGSDLLSPTRKLMSQGSAANLARLLQESCAPCDQESLAATPRTPELGGQSLPLTHMNIARASSFEASHADRMTAIGTLATVHAALKWKRQSLSRRLTVTPSGGSGCGGDSDSKKNDVTTSSRDRSPYIPDPDSPTWAKDKARLAEGPLLATDEPLLTLEHPPLQTQPQPQHPPDTAVLTVLLAEEDARSAAEDVERRARAVLDEEETAATLRSAVRRQRQRRAASLERVRKQQDAVVASTEAWRSEREANMPSAVQGGVPALLRQHRQATHVIERDAVIEREALRAVEREGFYSKLFSSPPLRPVPPSEPQHATGPRRASGGDAAKFDDAPGGRM